MANLNEADNFDAGVYQLETTDPVMGGPGGVSNSQAQALANRTRWLKNKLDALVITPTTPPQFDNDTSLATTGFVKRQGMESSGVTLVTATGALTAAHVGGTVVANAAGAITQSLPAANSVPAGARIEFMNINSGTMTLQRSGTDIIQVSGAFGNTHNLGTGDTATMVSNGVDRWYCVMGSQQLGVSNAFGSSKSGSGYQKLPSGVIIQWGGFSGSNTTLTFPIAFPSGPVGVVTQPQSGSNVQLNVNVGGLSATGFNAYPSAGNAASTFSFNYFAIGY